MIGTVGFPRAAELIIAVSGLVWKTKQQTALQMAANGGLFAAVANEKASTKSTLPGLVHWRVLSLDSLLLKYSGLKSNPVGHQKSC